MSSLQVKMHNLVSFIVMKKLRSDVGRELNPGVTKTYHSKLIFPSQIGPFLTLMDMSGKAKADLTVKVRIRPAKVFVDRDSFEHLLIEDKLKVPRPLISNEPNRMTILVRVKDSEVIGFALLVTSCEEQP
jgi:hypothetical protein